MDLPTELYFSFDFQTFFDADQCPITTLRFN